MSAFSSRAMSMFLAFVMLATLISVTMPDTGTAQTPDMPFHEDFEDSGSWGAWTMDGLWHVINDNTNSYPCPDGGSHSPTHSVWYGQDETGNYDTGNRTIGNLTSPVVDLSHSRSATLSFWYWMEGEFTFDYFDVYSKSIEDGSWSLNRKVTTNAERWTQISIPLNAYLGEKFQFKFVFDSQDGMFNDFRGAYIDDFKILSVENDVGVEELNVIDGLVSASASQQYGRIGSEITIQAVITNFGSEPSGNFDIFIAVMHPWDAKDNYPDSPLFYDVKTLTGLEEDGGTATLNFYWTPTLAAEYEIMIRTTLDADQDPWNDYQSYILNVVAEAFYDDMENGEGDWIHYYTQTPGLANTPPSGLWHLSWGDGIDAGYEGGTCWRCANDDDRYNKNTATETDEFLVSPAIDLIASGADKAYISLLQWWGLYDSPRMEQTRGADWVQILISTSDTYDPDDNFLGGDWEELGPQRTGHTGANYRSTIVDVSDYIGKTIYLKFQLHSNPDTFIIWAPSDDYYGWNIDELFVFYDWAPIYDVEISGNPEKQKGSMGDDTPYTITLWNTGNVDDTFTVSASPSAGATALFGTSNSISLPLLPNEKKSVTLNAKSNNKGTYTIDLTCEGQVSGVTATPITLTMEVVSAFEVEMDTKHMYPIWTDIDHPGSKDTGSGEKVMHNITVTNHNSSDESNVRLEIMNVPDGWTAVLSKPTFTLSKSGLQGDSMNVTLNITAPIGAKSGNWANITVMANSTTAPPTTFHSIIIYSYIVDRYGLDLSCDTPHKKAETGTDVTYVLNLQNIGNKDDDKISLVVNPPPGAWSPLLNPQGPYYTLQAFQSMILTFTLSVPTGISDGIYEIDIDAISNDGTTSTLTLSIEIGIKYDIDLLLLDNAATGNIGNQFNINMLIWNNGTQYDVISLEMESGATNWGNFNISSTDAMNETINNPQSIRLTVTIPNDATAGDHIIGVTAMAANNPSYKDTEHLTITVNPTYGVEIVASPSSIEAEPEEQVTFVVTVKNLGNSDDTFMMTSELPSDAGDWAVLWEGGTEVLSLPIDAFEWANISVGVAPSSNAEADDYDVTLKANSTNSGTTQHSTSVSVEVSQVYEIQLSAVDYDKDIDPTTQSSVTYTLTIENLGNGDDVVTLSDTGTAEDWATFTQKTVTLDAFQTRTVSVRMSPGATTAPDDYYLNILATSTQTTGVSDIVQINLTVLAIFDVEISLDDSEITIELGEDGSVELTIENGGNGADTVTIDIEGANEDWAEYVDSHTVAAGDSVIATITFSVPRDEKKEDYVYTIIATSSSGDTASETVTLKMEGYEIMVPYLNLTIIDLAIIIVVVILIGVVAAAFRSPKGPQQPKRPQERQAQRPPSGDAGLKL
jgi:uncharacterized membrane protein